MSILAPARRAFRPKPQVHPAEWFRRKVYTHEGRPFDCDAYPHITAPGGPCDALIDRGVRTIWLQWASRLGKTFFAQSAALYVAAIRAAPAMIAGPDEKTVKEVVQRIYGQMEKMRAMRAHLKPVRQRRGDRIDFRNSRQYVAWARSTSTLADKPVWFGHANEIDKWEHTKTSTEADPLKLFFERGKEFPSRKFIVESTPSMRNKSRVERGRLRSNNCQLQVPCPHCRVYQTLTMKQIKWDKLPSGRSDAELARKTAYYECRHCQERVEDEHRSWMMTRGVWCPEGCTVKDEAALTLFEPGGAQPWAGWSLASWIEGTPVRDGEDAGYQLSSLYALTLGWGSIAKEFVQSAKTPGDLRNFRNSWLAETWAEEKRSATWEDIGAKLILPDLPQGTAPRWAGLVTIGLDRQADNRFPYSVEAWGEERRNCTIAYGEVLSFAEAEKILRTAWPHAAGGTIRSAFALFDQGYRPAGIYEFCLRQFKAGFKCLPSKGSPGSLNADWTAATLGKNTSCPGMILYHMDTVRSQLWIDNALYDIPAGEPGSVALYQGSMEDHEDYLQQIINDAPIQKMDVHNNTRESWDRVDSNHPNDYRDTKRNAYTAMLITTKGGPIPPRTPGGSSPTPAPRGPQRPSPAAGAKPAADRRGGSRFGRLNLRR